MVYQVTPTWSGWVRAEEAKLVYEVVEHDFLGVRKITELTYPLLGEKTERVTRQRSALVPIVFFVSLVAMWLLLIITTA